MPKAYLNYIFFDENYANPVVGFKQVSVLAEYNFHKLSLSFAASTAGYLYIYVSNESSLDVNVYFDDMKITHKSDLSVIQADDYFPFGLTMAGTSYHQSGTQENKYLYNGKELQTDLNLDWYDYGFRFYDPALARFISVGILCRVLSPIALCFQREPPVIAYGIGGFEAVGFAVLPYE